MKYLIPILILSAGLLPKAGLCQLNNSGLYANFGVDADTRTNWMKYGILTGAVSSDDWFAPTGLGYNVIDTSNGPTYLAQLRAGSNISFNKRMSALLYAKMGGKLWLDAVYGRDFSAAAQLKDSTTFTTASKNGDNPTNWQGGVSSFPNKNDLVDVYAHMRRDGTSVYDSMWLFTGASTFGTRGSSYFDVELYKNSFTYSAATGTFTTAGTSGGHTQWLFDASGNIMTWAMFTALSAHDLTLSGVARDGSVSLHWVDAGASSVSTYEVERMDASSRFETIGTVDGGGCSCFVDARPMTGVNEYRLKAVSFSGSAYYSTVIGVAQAGSGNSVYFAGTNLIADMNKDQQAVLVVYDVTGQTLARQNVWLTKGNNTIALPVSSGVAPAVRVVGLMAEGKVVFAGRGLF